MEKNNGKYIVIKTEEILGIYDDVSTAMEETQKHPFETFLVKIVSKEDTKELPHAVFIVHFPVLRS